MGVPVAQLVMEIHGLRHGRRRSSASVRISDSILEGLTATHTSSTSPHTTNGGHDIDAIQRHLERRRSSVPSLATSNFDRDGTGTELKMEDITSKFSFRKNAGENLWKF